MLLPSIAALQQVDKEIITTLLRILLKSKEKGITKKSLDKMMALMGIKPLTWRVISEASGLLAKMERIRNQDQELGYNARNKLIAHAARILWLVRRPEAPDTLRRVL